MMGLTETILQIRKVVHKQRIHEFGGCKLKTSQKVHPVESNCVKIRRKGVDDHIYNRKHPQTFFSWLSWKVIPCHRLQSGIEALLTGRHVWHGQKILRCQDLTCHPPLAPKTPWRNCPCLSEKRGYPKEAHISTMELRGSKFDRLYALSKSSHVLMTCLERPLQ